MIATGVVMTAGACLLCGGTEWRGDITAEIDHRLGLTDIRVLHASCRGCGFVLIGSPN